MVAIPAEGRWTVRTLADGERDWITSFLEREPLLNVYLISRILDEGVRGSNVVGITCDSRLFCVASLTSNVVLAVAPDATEEQRTQILAILADRILTRGVPMRAMISDAALVEGLWSLIQRRFDPPTVMRLNQPVYALTGSGRTLPDLELVRYANLTDLDALVPACAAMHLEEVGINPLDRDAAGYRERIRELIYRRRSFILVDGGRIVFKTELSAITDQTVQLMGVWTAPNARQKGFARRGLAEICGHLMHRGQAVTLFVNDFNAPAIHLYEALGFRRIGCNRALIW